MAEVADGAGPPIVGNSTVSSSPPPIDWADVFNTTHRYGDATPPPEIDRWGQPSPPSTAPPLSPADSLATQLDCLPSHVRFTAGRVDGLRQALQALLTWPVEGREVLTTRHEPPAVLAALREWQGPLSYTLRYVRWPRHENMREDVAGAILAAVGPRTALVVFSQSYPRLLQEVPIILVYPAPPGLYGEHPNLPRQINAKPAAEGGPAGLRHIPVVVDLTDSVGWVQMVKLQAASAPDEVAQPPKQRRKKDLEKAELIKTGCADAYLCSGDHLVGSLDVGFLALPTEASAHSPAPSPTTEPSAASSRHLVDAFTVACARPHRVHDSITLMFKLVQAFVDHALEPLHCGLPRPRTVKCKGGPTLPDFEGPTWVHNLTTTRLAEQSSNNRWLVLGFRGVDADSLVQALAHPPADVKPVHSWYGPVVQPVLACVVPRGHPLLRVHRMYEEMEDSVVCFAPPWEAEWRLQNPNAADDGTVPEWDWVRVASTVAAVYVHLLRQAQPQWRTTLPQKTVSHYELKPRDEGLVDEERADGEVDASTELRSASSHPALGVSSTRRSQSLR